MDKQNSMGQRIQELRKHKGLTQTELAKEIHVSMAAIRNYENNLREPNSKAMAALERYFGVSGGYLRGETEIEEVEPMTKDAIPLEIERKELPQKLQELSSLLEGGKNAEVELAYHVVAELTHVLKMENKARRNAALSILQDMIATTVFFLDTCENCHRDSDPDGRIEYAKGIVKTQMALALSKADAFLTK